MKTTNEAIIKAVLKKIEQNLEEVHTQALIDYSGFSYFHFHRLFCAYVGESVKSYVKRLRLERAAYELNYKKLSVTEVALNAGFATPSAFNKAFKEFFSSTPSAFKKINPRAKEFFMIEPIKIITQEPIEVYAVRHVGAYTDIGQAFEKLMKWAYTHKIKHKKNLMGKTAFSYGISYDDPNVTPEEKLRSDACISADDDVSLDDGIQKQNIAGGKYAVFLHKGEYTKLKETYNAIFSSYVKTNNIRLRDVPVFEKYLNRDPRRTKAENLRTEIYLPIN